MTNDNDTAVNLRYLEFYAGVGGWRMALDQAVRDLGSFCCDDDNDHDKKQSHHHHQQQYPQENKNGDPSQQRQKSQLQIQCHCAGALDHSDLCVSVYEHNFGNPNHDDDTAAHHPHTKKRRRKQANKKLTTVNIETLTRDDLENQYAADLWFLSPPCQPHTRQHDKQAQEQADPRSKSFGHLCDLLEEMGNDENNDSDDNHQQPLPRMICLENVVQFETSASCQRFRIVLQRLHYHYAEFHLTPTQVQLPNDRPRYFGVAVRQRRHHNGNGNDNNNNNATTNQQESVARRLLQSYFTKRPDSNNDDDSPTIHTSIPELNVVEESQVQESDLPQLKTFLDEHSHSVNNNSDNSQTATLRVPDKVLDRNAAWCFDIVTPQQARTACFTSSYGRLVRGTGSILYMTAEPKTGVREVSPVAIEKESNCDPQPNGHDDDSKNTAPQKEPPSWQLVAPQDRTFDSNAWMKEVDRSQLRYFSGMEMARLFGFSKDFNFPSSASLKQQWKLIGNSINSRLASRLILLGLIIILQEDDLKPE